jgi:DNA-binding MarR family transcriptional regulator
MAQSKRQRPPSTRAGVAKVKRHRKTRAVDYNALASLRLQLRKFLAFSENAAQKAGLTPQQHQALLAIKGLAGPELTSVGDLARALLIRHHSAVELTARMTKLGLIDRAVDAEDGRRVLLTLTARGEQKLQALSAIHLEELKAVGPTLVTILRQFRKSRKR